MKKLYLTLLTCLTLGSASAAISDWGPADTIACYNVGPGIEYTKIIYHERPLIMWYSTIDLQNQYNKIEQVQSRHQVPDVNRWDVMEHFKENSRPGHRVRTAWNHDFFSYDQGICIGANISNGQIAYTLWGRSMLAITKDKKAEVFLPVFDTKVIAADGTEVVIDIFNSNALAINGDCVFFNHLNSRTLTDAGKYIKVQPQAEWIVNGPDIPCKILEISDSPLQTSKTECVIYLRNGKQNALDGHVAVGQTINVRQKMVKSNWGNVPENILNAFHGYPSIAHDGVLHEGEYNNFENGREHEESSHVMVGISKDKTKLYVCINEMSAQSKPIDCVDMATWMLERGAWDIVNFDSGGSAAIVVNEKMENLPGRGSIRPVEDAMLAVSLAPDDATVDHLTFSKPYFSCPTIAVTPLKVISYNKYGDIIEEGVSGCSFKVVPENLGYVDAEGIFHSTSTGGVGKIIAEKDGKTGEITVTIQTASNITAKYPNILIDSTEQYPLEIEGVINGATHPLDATAFSWETEDPTVATVENGMLRGLKDGTTTVTGTFENLSIKIAVDVEIGIGKQSVYDFKQFATDPNVTKSGLTGLTLQSTLPEGWTDGALYYVESISGRTRTAKLKYGKTIFGLPDALELPIFNKDGAIKRITLSWEDNLGNRNVSEITVNNTDETYRIDFAEDGKKLSVPAFPIKLNEIIIYFNSVQKKTFGFGNLVAVYPKTEQGGISAITSDNDICINISGAQANISFPSNGGYDANIKVYSTTGRLELAESIKTTSGINNFSFNTEFFATGIYVAVIEQNGISKAKKFIIR